MRTPAAIWTWSVDTRLHPARLCAALEAVIARPVIPLGIADPARLPAEAVVCDVWHTSGDFPTIVECYGPPAGVVEAAVVAALARRLGHRCLVADDTLNPSRHLLALPDGTLRPAHVDVADTEDGAAHSNARLCTIATQRCRESEECRRSRWEPDLVVAAPNLDLTAA
ncbi:hypothetical protein RB614_18250 [Phytohabitans sp. ZYX-F-186]|uniref:Uncharacterized protein n=1 Tax=Phytohabitans maris TaxID=3071409 RepID=A0ABU0ZJ76_9ACTN|nr:hypothetical protein [Phytohabitans sp. ZYX-F-186]MDQ7906459.1 hypothetical protein [Phytohabitans sp. ZYX-F-186]